jgi:hypothetical protein
VSIELDWKIERAWIDNATGLTNGADFRITLTDPALPGVSTLTAGTIPLATPLPHDAAKQEIVDGVIATMGPQLDQILDHAANHLHFLYTQAHATPVPVFDGVLPPDEARANFPELSPPTFWKAASVIGITKAGVIAQIEQIEDENLKTDMLIDIEEATGFYRLNPTVVAMVAANGITPEQLDALWMWAANK